MTPLIVIPAAGASSRMKGRDKLLEPVEGKPLLRRQAEMALATGCPVMVALPPGGGARRDALEGLGVTQIEVRDAAEGLGATLRTAALFIARHAFDRPMMILLPDVPEITVFDIKSVLSRFEARGGDTPTRATNDANKPGTPLIVPPRLIPAFTKLTGDDGGRAVLQDEDVVLVPLSNDRATRDLDTPEDWAAWRKDTGVSD
ncbi:MAG: nucleotidyltransferase family protein [Paracoccaceae bacterium]|nr:nucleotidyltransferase family protein [Paracoccaceae bacterium]